MDSITDAMDMSLSEVWEMVKNREACCTAASGVAKSWTRLSHRTRMSPISARSVLSKGKTVLEMGRFLRVLVTHLMGAPLVTTSPRACEMPTVKAANSPRPRAWAPKCQVRNLAIADGEQRGGPLTSQKGENTSPSLGN